MLNPDNSKYLFPGRTQPAPGAEAIKFCRNIADSVDAAILSIAAKDESSLDSQIGRRGDVYVKSPTSQYEDEIVVERLTFDPKHPPTKENPTRGVTKMDSGDGFESVHFERNGSKENYQMRYIGRVDTEFCRDTKTGAVTILTYWQRK